MIPKTFYIFPLILLASLFTPTLPYNILGIFAHAGRSHFTVFNPLMLELSKRGHNVTVLSHFPESHPPKGYTPISLRGTGEILLNNVDPKLFHKSLYKPIDEMILLGEWGNDNCRNILNLPQVRDRLNETYDLVITEQFNCDCFLIVPHLLNVPFVSLSTCTVMSYHHDRFGLPNNPAYVPNNLLFYSDRMSLMERTINTVTTVLVNYLLAPMFITNENTKVAREYYGKGIPYLESLGRETSLVLVNTYFSLNRPRVFPGNVVEVGGIHVNPVKALPKDLQTFLEDAPNGVIYFNFGSMLRAADMDPEKLKIFLDVFAQLPQKVLWKYENDTLPVPLSNVMTRKWLPQNDILAHSNVITFISHCGLGGTIESTHHGVPMICLPFYGDQYANAAAVEENGAGVNLLFDELSSDDLRSALEKTLGQSYRERAKELSRIYRDRPVAPMDLAVYWVEYVVRHRGAKFLKPHSMNLNFFQYHLLDVLAVLLVVFGLIVISVWYIVKQLYRLRSKKLKKS